MVSSTASIRNCERMLPFCAPIALRIPISRVRSVTVTSMMFMTPMPPTSNEIAATAPSSVVNTSLVLLDADSSEPWFRTLSDDASVVVKPFSVVMVLVTCVDAAFMTSLETASTLMLESFAELPVSVS